MSTFFSAPEQPKEGIVLGNNSPSESESHSRPQSKGKSSRAASEKSTLIEGSRKSNATADDVHNNDTTTAATNDEATKEALPNGDVAKETAVKGDADKESSGQVNKEDSDNDGEKCRG